MLLPLLLIIPALLAMGTVAYGMGPNWAAVPHGVELILFTRRFEGVLVVVSLALCVGLIALVAGGKRRSWWLLALLPIVLLFMHHFGPGQRSWRVHDDAAFESAEEAGWLRDGDWVVGLEANGAYYAYPYSLLYAAPVVVQSQQARRIMLMWSPFANRARAYWIDRQIKARELEVVSMPANALLLYDSRYGQFINGLTGRTMEGDKPIGFHDPLETVKMTWGQWRGQHPGTRVLMPIPGQSAGPAGVLRPYYKLPQTGGKRPQGTAIALIDAPGPVAVEHVTEGPMNFRAGKEAVLLVRDEASGRLRAFDRSVGEEMYPEFRVNPGRSKHPKAVWVDSDTGGTWDRDGAALSGPLGKMKRRLKEWPVEEGLYWGVMKFWYPELEIRE
jgi:hypothetical protein